MKKGKIATLAAFCAIFATLCLTACGDEGKENATPLPTNTAVQTETAKPTENPTEVPTAELTAEPTERPLLVKNYVPIKAKKLSKDFCLLDDANANGFEIDESLAYKISGEWISYKDDFIPHNDMWIPKGTREYGNYETNKTTTYYVFDYIDNGDCLIVVANFYNDRLTKSNLEVRHISTFTYSGELINTLWEYKDFDQFKIEESKFFSCDNKLYFTVIAHEDKEPLTNGTNYTHTTADNEKFSIYFNPFWIYEIGKNKIDFIWDESILVQYEEILNHDFSKKEGVLYDFKEDGVDVYLSDSPQSKSNLEQIQHFSFHSLLSDINSGITKKEETKFSDKELLENEMLKSVYTEIYYDGYIKSQNLWYNPRDNSKEKYTCDFYYIDDYILLVSSPIHNDEYSPHFIVASFNKEGKLNKVHWRGRGFLGGNWEYKVFVRGNSIYIATAQYLERIGKYTSDRESSPLYIYEFGKDSWCRIWDENVFLPNFSNDGASLKTCYDAYSWKFNNENEVDMYFYNENSEEFEYVKSFTFDELLSGVDITDW